MARAQTDRNRSRRSRRAELARAQASPGLNMPAWPGVAAAALVGLVYLSVASSGTFRFGPSLFPHHVLVADAWLHGQLNVRDEIIKERQAEFYRRYRAALEDELRARGRELTEAGWRRFRSKLTAPVSHDWSVVDGKYYGYWGPMVPALLLPYVAVAGLQTSDRLFSCLVGTGTVLLTFLMLRQAWQTGLIPLTTSACTALAVLLGLGTVHFYLSIAGQVWFLSEIVATFFATMAIWLLLRGEAGIRWTVAAGAAFGASFLSRNSVLVVAPFFYIVLFALWNRRAVLPARQIMRHAIAFSIPLLIAAGITMAFNYARFGNVLESGQGIQVLSGSNPVFKQDYVRYGRFSFHYLLRNVYYYFLNVRLLHDPTTGALTFDPWGNSMFLVTPALLYVFRSRPHGDWFIRATWIGAGAAMVLLLLFHNTGWVNFGNRYLLDLMPLAILLVAIGMRGRLTPVRVLAIALSILVNAWGTYRFCLHRC